MSNLPAEPLLSESRCASVGVLLASKSQAEIRAVSVALNRGMSALVDEADYARVAAFRWTAYWNGYGTFYAVRDVNGRHIYLHRFILDAKPGEVVDHINFDGLNCCRSNLRICTHSQNCCNRKRGKSGSSKFKGVNLRKNGTWRARIRHQGLQFHIGYFANEIDAAMAYDLAAKKHHGEFAFLNFPEVE